MENFPKLVEDIVQTSINTGPRGPLRLAQGIQAVIGVGSEWLADLSKVIALLFSSESWNIQYFMLLTFYTRCMNTFKSSKWSMKYE